MEIDPGMSESPEVDSHSFTKSKRRSPEVDYQTRLNTSISASYVCSKKVRKHISGQENLSIVGTWTPFEKSQSSTLRELEGLYRVLIL